MVLQPDRVFLQRRRTEVLVVVIGVGVVVRVLGLEAELVILDAVLGHAGEF